MLPREGIEARQITVNFELRRKPRRSSSIWLVFRHPTPSTCTVSEPTLCFRRRQYQAHDFA